MTAKILMLGKRTFLDSCIHNLLNKSGFAVTLEEGNEFKSFDTINSIQPDILIVICHDSKMLDLANLIKGNYDGLRVVILSIYNEKDDMILSLNLDMDGYLSVFSSYEELIEDLNAVSRGEKRVSQRLMSFLIRSWKNDLNSPNKNISHLDITSRELDILNLMAKGRTNKEIGRYLNISPNTVKYLISRLFVKFSASSRADVVYKGYAILKNNKLQ